MKSFQRHSMIAGLTPVLLALFAAGCVPGNYNSLPVPSSGSVVKRQAADGSGGEGDDANNPGGATNPGGTGPGAGATASPGAGTKPGFTFGPGVPETDALRKCLNLWGTTPFKEVKANQVKVMDVSVGIGGVILPGGLGDLLKFGNTRDFEVTSEPRLIVIPLSVNVGGTTTFELMNPNGWYCMKAAVGAKSTLNVKLNCSAKIAQSDLGITLRTNPPPASGTPGLPVSVGVNDGRTPGSQLGIMVDSTVNLTRVDSTGAANCPP